MQKIPVGATVAHAYRFAFGHAADIFKAIWLPLLAQLRPGDTVRFREVTLAEAHEARALRRVLRAAAHLRAEPADRAAGREHRAVREFRDLVAETDVP